MYAHFFRATEDDYAKAEAKTQKTSENGRSKQFCFYIFLSLIWDSDILIF